MNRKQKQRLARAIGTTILSYAALSLAAIDKAQAAVLTYNFQVGDNGGSGFFKFDNSSLTGIGDERVGVSEGRFNTFLTATDSYYGVQGKNYYDLVGATVVFFEGEFRGLQARGSDSASSREITTFFVPGTVRDPGPGPYNVTYDISANWSMENIGSPGISRWFTYFTGLSDTHINEKNGRFNARVDRFILSTDVSYTLVDTATEPVPEPVTFAGTALALAGLSWLKSQKKQAV
ncbi:MAG: hypothetical protein MUE44_15515 [Oscillatoriaceae cyanobacterium Prado104]|jgi:hypothetical protein|nr:hypothetical protein [Oscillatoriaceae cyanobacterium Prado104]